MFLAVVWVALCVTSSGCQENSPCGLPAVPSPSWNVSQLSSRDLDLSIYGTGGSCSLQQEILISTKSPMLEFAGGCPWNAAKWDQAAVEQIPQQSFVTCVFERDHEHHTNQTVPRKEVRFADKQPALVLLEKPYKGMLLRPLDSQSKVLLVRLPAPCSASRALSPQPSPAKPSPAKPSQAKPSQAAPYAARWAMLPTRASAALVS